MSHETAVSVVKLIIIGLLCQVVVVGYVFWTDYEGRKITVHAVREGCERDKRSRSLNAVGWRIAEDARRRAGEIGIADRYKDLAQQLEGLASINCNERYPEASLIP